MRCRAPALAIAIAFAAPLATAQQAPAAPPVFAAPQELASSAMLPLVAMGPRGDAVIAWQGAQGGVFMARRGALGGPLSAPAKVSDDWIFAMHMARNERGDVALAWFAPDATGVGGQPRVAIAAPGQPASALEFVPLPARAPGVANERGRTFSWPEVAVGADGTIAVSYSESDSDAHISRTLVSVRPAGGQFGAPQVLMTVGDHEVMGPLTNAALLAADGLGRLHAVWSMEPGGPHDGLRIFASTALPGQPFEQGRLISSATTSANALATPVANARGDVVAVWSSGQFGPFPRWAGQIEAARRLPSGQWSPPQQLSPEGEATYFPTLAFNDRGDSVAAWPTPAGTATSFQPAGGAFGQAMPSPVGVAFNSDVPIALDAFGDSVAVRSDGDQVFAQLRVRDAAPGREIAISPRGGAKAPTIAMDRFGNGIAAWTTYRDGVPHVTAAAYSALPPTLAKLRVGARRLRFRASETARVRITIKRKHGARRVSQTAVARPGSNKLKFSKRMRRLLRRNGRYTLTARARDAGPRAATYKIKFRRR